MKSLVIALAALLMLPGTSLCYGEGDKGNGQSEATPVSVVCSPGLYQLASGWANEYTRQNPGSEINVFPVDEARIDQLRQSERVIGLFTGDELLKPGAKQAWKMSVGRDVTVPVINAGNPYMDELLKKGITAEAISMLISSPDSRNWGTVLGDNKNLPVHLYLSNDEKVLYALGNFTGLGSLPADLVKFASADEVIRAVQADPYAIGFCKMVNITGPDSRSLLSGLQMLPIDKNKNGRIDYMENIYDQPENFARGVWIGKYPRVLYNDVYWVSDIQPEATAEVAFLKWVLAGGQRFLGENGLSELVMGERQSKLDQFNVVNIIPPSKEPYSLSGIFIISFIAIIVFSILISRVLYLGKKRMYSVPAGEKAVPVYFSKHSVNIPKGLYYDKTHTWAFLERDGIVKIGIDDFLQHVTGPITRIEMRKPGEKVRKGDMILTIIQHGKQLIVFAPLSGVIKENNALLNSQYTLINSSPYSDGWVYRIEPTNWLREMQLMEMAEKYQDWLTNEFSRLKDFLAGSLKVNKMEYDAIVLQDGGTLKDGVLEEFGPEVWEDFQSNFLDSAY